MIKGFRDFIAKGNVIDLAVAVVIGAAFSAIVTAIVSDLINPLIAAIFNAEDLSGALIVPLPGGTTDPATGVYTPNGIKFGAILGAVISFFAVAVVVYFVFVYPMNKYKERQAARLAAKAGPAEAPAPTTEELLAQIRDLLASRQEK